MSEKIIAAAAIVVAAAAAWFVLRPEPIEPAPVADVQQVAIGIPVAPDAQAAPADSKDQAHALYTEGLRYFQAADYARAREKWTEALRFDPDNAEAAAGLDRIKKITGK
ncbi:MAG: hypothetical protein FD189_1679 [Elusimicrobia bacterium]|nr:MAG: hypothetical protein FD154_1845 [Elusimicrobiota bacterium]KAF0154799.1 MAG: hypothetical protein FD189_1679 [Elusimicrobiota bacterium]